MSIPDVPSPRRWPALWRRRLLWWPTAPGWLLLGLLGAGAAAAVWYRGEDFLAVTDRPGRDVLVVEGWIGHAGVNAAAQEFFVGNYRHVIATSGLTSDRWDTEQWSYAELAARDLRAAGVPAEAVLVAPPRETRAQRTYESALAVRATLARRGLAARSLTVFTLGAHARRSRLVYHRVLGPQVRVGVVAWRPALDYTGPWWRSSERAEDFLKECVAYGYEAALHSGRGLFTD